MKHFEIKILGISGIENLKEMQCVVLLDDNSPTVYSLKDTEFPLFSIAVHNSRSLQIAVRHVMSNEVIGTAYFDIQMLPQHRKVWVPLSNGEHREFCKGNRRICLYSTIDFDLSSVVEQSSPDSSFLSQMDQLNLSNACLEINENYKNIATSLSGKNKTLRLKVFQLEKELENVVGDRNTENQENPLEKEVEKMNCLMGNLSTLNKDLQKQASSYEMLYKVEKYQREHLEKQVGSLAKQIDELITTQSDRESELIHEISNKDKQNTSLQTELNAFQDQKRVLQLELISWRERASLSSTKSDTDIENRLSILT